MVKLAVVIGMLPLIQFDPRAQTPIYRQIYEQIKSAIDSWRTGPGRKAAADSGIGWLTWTEPDHRRGRLRAARIRGLDPRARRAGKLRRGPAAQLQGRTQSGWIGNR